MPMFFSAPPKPVPSWPLKWVSERNTSASMTARPIFACADVLAVDRHEHVVVALEAVGDDRLAAGAEGVVAVLVGDVQVVQRVLARADVERGAVGRERLAAQRLDEVRDRAGVVRPQEGEVALLAEVHLDGGELVLEVDLLDARGAAQANQLVAEVLVADGAHGGKVDLRFCHDVPSSRRNVISKYKAHKSTSLS